nr:hypothetical protein [Tanacetum cinerariifolium]
MAFRVSKGHRHPRYPCNQLGNRAASEDKLLYYASDIAYGTDLIRSKILHSIEGTVLGEEIFSEFNKSIAMASNEKVNIKDHSFSPNSKIELFLFNSNYCISSAKKGSSHDEKNFAIDDIE